MSIELGDQQVVHFLEDQKGLFSSEAWPRHVALSPWFGVSPNRQDELSDELKIIARRWQPIVADVGDEEFIGRRHNLPVTIIGAETLKAFTYNLVNVISRLGGAVRSSDFMSGHYRPHIVHDYSDSLSPDVKKLKIGRFSLVQTIDNPAADREVTATYKLEGIK